MQAFPAETRKRIKKQYLCQCKTFAERLNPHCGAAQPPTQDLLDTVPSYPVPPEQTPGWVGWNQPGLASPWNPQHPSKEDPRGRHANLGVGHRCPLGLGNNPQSSGRKDKMQLALPFLVGKSLCDPFLGCGEHSEKSPGTPGRPGLCWACRDRNGLSQQSCWPSKRSERGMEHEEGSIVREQAIQSK